MCGIAGAFNLKSEFTTADVLEIENLAHALAHRGPSQQGSFANPRVALVNTRLSIQDLSANASLPMSNDDQSVWLAFNGEISNFKELKRSFNLDQKYRFKSNSDTEVLLRLYEELGIGFVNHLSGMFAIALYDLRNQKGFLVRDFFGINPLFYMVKNDVVYFSSELKAFFDLKAFSNRIDGQSLYHYFSLAYIPSTRTPYLDVEELWCGQKIEIDLRSGTWKLMEHYRPTYEENPDISEDEAATKIHELLKDSVRRNLISDAPIGTTLSGGVDTSAIVSLARELGLSEKLHTFSIKMGETTYDESMYQQLVARSARTQHHEILVKPEDVIENLVKHVSYLDEPNGDGAAIPFFILARDAKKFVDVLLSGEGGDEVFNAYETHAAYKARMLYRKYVPHFMRSIIRKGVSILPTDYGKLSLDFVAKRFTEGAELDVTKAHIFWRHPFTDDDKRRLFQGSVKYDETSTVFDRIYNDPSIKDGLNRISMIDLRHFITDDLMVKNDRMFLANSVESRFPFLDRILVDYVTKLPSGMRMKGFRRRYIEKKALRNTLPRAILKRSNFGLEMPHSRWFATISGFREYAESFFTRERFERSGILDYDQFKLLWREHLSGRRDLGRGIWTVLIFLIWFDLFIYERNYKTYWRDVKVDLVRKHIGLGREMSKAQPSAS